MPGYRWTTATVWRDRDGREWSLPTGMSRVEAEAMAAAWGWAVVDIDVETAVS